MFKFKKVASIMASTLMIGSTVALAAASTFPAPFTGMGGNDVAVVYGNTAAQTDLVAAMNIMQSLNDVAVGTSVTTGTTASVTGEAYPLFTSGTKLYVNDTLNTVRTTLTKTELPTVLKKGTFSGNVEATYEQMIDMGSNPKVNFARQPLSTDDPEFGLAPTSAQSGNVYYNASITFNKAVNFTHADSKGQDLTMFGQKFTVASSTDATSLILLKTAEKISLTSEDPSAEVTIAGKKYTIDLVSASTTDATVKVTDENGNSETKSVNENASKKIQGVTIAVTTADSNNLKYIASVIAGAEKVTLTNGAAATKGDNDDRIDGTLVTITGTTTATTKIVFGIYAPNSNNDAIMPGKSLVDPIFGTMKLDFPSLSVASDDETKRENILVTPQGDDKIDVTFRPSYLTEAKTFTWAKNLSNGINLQEGDNGYNITVMEMGQTFVNGYMVIGNEESGRLIQVTSITNGTTVSGDKITFYDAFTKSKENDAVAASAQGTTTVTLGTKTYDVTYDDNQANSDANWVRINSRDSSAAGQAILYPTIRTSKGAKLAFYTPLTINLTNWDGSAFTNNLTSMRFPDGDGYGTNDVGISGIGVDNSSSFNVTVGSTVTCLDVTAGGACTVGSATAVMGKLTYNITANAANTARVFLLSPNGGNIVNPALVIWEEKDDNTEYQALVVTLDPGASSSNGLDVSDVLRTWGEDSTWYATKADSDITKKADLYGIIATKDANTGGHTKATISYPDEQIFANLYMGEESASITGGSSGGGTGGGTTVGIPILDSEASSASTKNWIVVGGSCVNSVAADLLGVTYPTCGADWTTATKVGAGEYLIQTFAQGTGTKIATLVAGFNAGDTTNAATYLRTQTGDKAIDTTVGKKYVNGVMVTSTIGSTSTTA